VDFSGTTSLRNTDGTVIQGANSSRALAALKINQFID
jgi:hypothetical protein